MLGVSSEAREVGVTRGMSVVRARSMAPGFLFRVLSAAPTRLVDTWLAVVRLSLEQNPPCAPVAGLRVEAGPWRLQGDWWQDHELNRDYYDVELSDGGIYRLFLERDTGEWFVDGICG